MIFFDLSFHVLWCEIWIGVSWSEFKCCILFKQEASNATFQSRLSLMRIDAGCAAPYNRCNVYRLGRKRLLMERKTASLSSLLDVSKIDVEMVSCVRWIYLVFHRCNGETVEQIELQSDYRNLQNPFKWKFYESLTEGELWDLWPGTIERAAH